MKDFSYSLMFACHSAAEDPVAFSFSVGAWVCASAKSSKKY